MLAASDTVAGADTPLDIVLGAGMLLLFTGVLVRALARQHCGLSRTSLLHALLRALTDQSDSSKPRPRTTSAGPDRAQASASPAPTSPWPRIPEPAGGRAAEAAREHAHVDRANPKLSAAPPDAREPEHTRLSRASLERLGCTLDESRRLHAAEDRVAEELAALSEASWLVERDVQLGVRRIPFLIIGTTGVFALSPTDGAWNLRDLRVLSELGEHVCRQLPGYAGPVHAAVCLAFDAMKPRAWYDGQDERGRGGWVPRPRLAAQLDAQLRTRPRTSRERHPPAGRRVRPFVGPPLDCAPASHAKHRISGRSWVRARRWADARSPREASAGLATTARRP